MLCVCLRYLLKEKSVEIMSKLDFFKKLCKLGYGKLGYVFIKNNFLLIFHANFGRMESGISFEDWRREGNLTCFCMM